MELSRRQFLSYLGMLCAASALPASAAIPHDTVKEQKKKIESEMIEPGQLRHFSLEYSVRMLAHGIVPMKTTVRMYLDRADETYASTVRIDAPKLGVFGDTWLADILVYRRRSYRETVRGLNTILEETMHLEDRFMTDSLVETIPEKYDERQTEIRVDFDYDRNFIFFYRDKNSAQYDEAKRYAGQQGPFTAFWNYCFGMEPVTDFTVMNVLKRTIEEGGQRHWEYNFKNNPISTRHHKGHYILASGNETLLDLIRGDITYDIACNSHVIVPVQGRVDMVIQRTALARGEIRPAASNVEWYLTDSIIKH